MARILSAIKKVLSCSLPSATTPFSSENKLAISKLEVGDLKRELKKAETKLEKFAGLEILGVKELMKLSTQKVRANMVARQMKERKKHASNTLNSVRNSPLDGYTGGWRHSQRESERDSIARRFVQRDYNSFSQNPEVTMGHSMTSHSVRAVRDSKEDVNSDPLPRESG